MKILLLGPGSDSFADALTEGGIEYERHTWQAQPGVIMNATGDWLEILGKAAPGAGIGAGIFGAVAAVASQWMKAKAARKIIITTKGQKVIHMEGYSVEDFAKVLADAKEVSAIDREKPAFTKKPKK